MALPRHGPKAKMSAGVLNGAATAELATTIVLCFTEFLGNVSNGFHQEKMPNSQHALMLLS